jgi:tetratricopeptide (TPR) repeat protein
MIPSNIQSLAHELHLKAEAASDLKRFSDAQALAIQAITADPEFGDGFASLGRALLGLGKTAEAEKQFREALTKDAVSFWYLRGLTICLKVRRQYGEALFMANKVIELYPNAAESFLTRGDIRHLERDYSAACADYRIALSLDPQSVSAHIGLGDSLLAMKKFKEAEFHYREALSTNPNSANTLNNLGVCLERQSKLKDAALVYKAAVLVDPELKVAKSNTKLVLDRYLGVGFGSAVLFLWCIVKVATVSDRNTPSGSIVFFTFLGALIVLGLHYIYRLCEQLDRRNELAREDPELLEVYETIKKDTHRSA